MNQKQEARARRMRKENRKRLHLLPPTPQARYERIDQAAFRNQFQRTPIERTPYPPLDELLKWAEAVKEKRNV